MVLSIFMPSSLKTHVFREEFTEGNPVMLAIAMHRQSAGEDFRVWRLSRNVVTAFS
jgi:hypothetical protein